MWVSIERKIHICTKYPKDFLSIKRLLSLDFREKTTTTITTKNNQWNSQWNLRSMSWYLHGGGQKQDTLTSRFITRTLILSSFKNWRKNKAPFEHLFKKMLSGGGCYAMVWRPFNIPFKRIKFLKHSVRMTVYYFFALYCFVKLRLGCKDTVSWRVWSILYDQ